MNVQRATVISDSSGVTGLAMSRALLAGERDPAPRAAFNDDRLTASPHTRANRLEGNGRDAGRCKLRPSLALYDVYQPTIAACDARLEAHLHPCDRTIEVHTTPAPTSTRRPTNARRPEPPCARHPPLDRSSGVDLTRLDGIEGRTAQTRMSEIGLAMSRWKTAQHFASGRG